jgi:hypothetical protein
MDRAVKLDQLEQVIRQEKVIKNRFCPCGITSVCEINRVQPVLDTKTQNEAVTQIPQWSNVP